MNFCEVLRKMIVIDHVNEAKLAHVIFNKVKDISEKELKKI
jgi:hypothetical protein